MVCPPGQVHFTVQPFTGALPARTVTVDWNPPGQLLVVSIVAEHAPVTGDGVEDGLVRGDGLVFGLVPGDGLVFGVA
ncbi:hypothetical protein AAH991_19910, partial [Microbispora sp. ZYX-F-249]